MAGKKQPSPFRARQRVACFSTGQLCGLATVRRVTARFVELAHGSGVLRYQPDGGDRYPRSRDPWHHSTIEPATQAHRDEVAHARLVGQLRGVRWEDLSVETLRAVWGLLEDAKPEEPSK